MSPHRRLPLQILKLLTHTPIPTHPTPALCTINTYTRPLTLRRMLPLIPQLSARLPGPRVAETCVDVCRGGAADCALRGRFDAFFAVAAEHVSVVGLAGSFVDGVRLECVGGGGGAGWEGFGAEFGDGVVAGQLACLVLEWVLVGWKVGVGKGRLYAFGCEGLGGGFVWVEFALGVGEGVGVFGGS